jgi:hypothetical protein
MAQIHDYEDAPSGHSERVELKVHGVGGTPPESMLDSPEIVRVRGDATAAFFRQKERQATDEYVQEAYSWGGLTSGSASRAFWVFLAPFAFLNVAGWMLPGASTDPEGRAESESPVIAAGLLRLIGFTVTVHAVVWTGQMSIDFFAWQCGGNASCRTSNWVASVFDLGIFGNAPGRRLVLGALVPLLVILVLYLLTRRTVDRYETVDDAMLEDYEVVGKDSFADPTFWRRGRSISSFASLHLAGAGAALAWILAWTFAWLQPAGTPWFQLALGVAGLVLLLASGVSIALVRGASPATDESVSASMQKLVRWHRWITAGVLLAVLLVGWFWPGYQDPGRTTALDPYGDIWRSIWMVSVVALIVFAFIVLADPRRTRRIRAPLSLDDGDAQVVVGFGSFGAVVAAFFGFLVAVAMLGGFGAATARLLGGRPMILYSYLYDAFGFVTTVWVIVLFVAITLAWFARRPQPAQGPAEPMSPLEEEITAGFEEDRRSFFTGERRKHKWLVSVRNARDLRAFVPVLEAILGWMVVIGMATAFALLGIQFLAPDALQSWINSWPSQVFTATSWFVAVGIPVGMIWAIRRAYGSRQARKLIGTLWDVVTFWPRWFHPLAPPSYSGRAVPELRTRIDALVRGGSRDLRETTVVVTAHSQGSVLALAALDGLRGQDWLDNVSLVTHGSPITRLYVRLFPAHMVDPIERVLDALYQERWVNLYRLTDPIGGAITGETVIGVHGSWVPGTGRPLTDRLPDHTDTWSDPIPDPDLSIYSDGGPQSPVYPKKGDPYPPPLGHSHYDTAPQFIESVRILFGL